MSDEKKPFAWVAPHQATQGVLPPGKDYIVTGWQVLGWAPLEGVFYFRKEDAEAAASVVNAAVERERREAAVKSLREAADWLIRFPHSASEDGKFATANAMLDGITVAVTGLRSRADKIERGEQ